MSTSETEVALSPRERIAVALGILPAGMMSGLDTFAVSVALPSMQGALSATLTEISWILTSYLVASAIFMCVFVVWVYRKAPELRYHLNAVSTSQIGRWWYACVGLIVPVMLVVMLVQTILIRIDEPYGDYDPTYLWIAGWGTVALLLVGALVFTLPRWRGPEAFTAWPAYPPRQDPAVMKEALR